ncbi:MAG: hypothetical protein ACYDBJ_27345 [Aggregatilineales bacterium]
MMKFDCPIPIRQQYGKLSAHDLRVEIQKALDHPSAEYTQSWEQWRAWLVRFSIHYLRPTTGDSLKCCRWLAFALRYLHPLIAGEDRPHSGEAVMNVIKNYAAVVAALLFDSEMDCFESLKNAFEPTMLDKDVTLSPEHQAILREVQHRSSDEKMARLWSSKLLDPLKVKVVEYFHPVEEQVLHELTHSVFGVNDPTSSPSSGYRTQLERYIDLAKERDDRLLLTHAQGYLNESTKRLEIVGSYAKFARWSTVFLIMVLVSIATSFIEPALKVFLIGLVVFNGLALFYGRLFDYLRQTFASEQAALETLQAIVEYSDEASEFSTVDVV